MPILSPKERRQRNREEMTTAILETARDIMRQDGVTALNLNEIARRLGMTTPAIYVYFPSKDLLYDALYQMAARLFRESEEEIWHTTKPDWNRIRAWFDTRLELASAHHDLYHLQFDAPVPGFVPSAESQEEVRKLLAGARRGLTEVIEAGVIDPGIPAEDAVDLLLCMRRGIVAEHLGKRYATSVSRGSCRPHWPSFRLRGRPHGRAQRQLNREEVKLPSRTEA
jgi:AcrR family transcriptional regulator